MDRLAFLKSLLALPAIPEIAASLQQVREEIIKYVVEVNWADNDNWNPNHPRLRLSQ